MSVLFHYASGTSEGYGFKLDGKNVADIFLVFRPAAQVKTNYTSDYTDSNVALTSWNIKSGSYFLTFFAPVEGLHIQSMNFSSSTQKKSCFPDGFHNTPDGLIRIVPTFLPLVSRISSSTNFGDANSFFMNLSEWGIR